MPQDRAHVPSQPLVASPSSGGAIEDGQPAGHAGSTYFLGRYRVVDEIGVGGMASVHLARMDGPGGFQKWVAIKRIHPHLVEDESFVNMFLDEARVAARISHPNVATVFELGKHEDTYWIAMEYLHGEPLREVMRRTEDLRQPMPPEIACRAIADAAEGLHAAHELLGRNGEKLQLVHRDVTPHNLFVTYDGCTKVVDFGIAKFSSRMASTRAGTLKGKLAYMSPEQVAGEAIDRRTDVFALGVVLWELTTGQRLFRTDNDLDTLAKVQECVVPRPSTIVRGYPIDLEKIAMKALAKNKNERYATARELSRALQSLLMRRGLFIGSDELAAYMASIFGERIKKREAHLRWAAEVTQTIDIDRLKAMPSSSWRAEDGSLHSFNSEIQASLAKGSRGAPRPIDSAAEPRSQLPVSTSGIPTPMAMDAARQSIDLEAKLTPERPNSPIATAPLPALVASGITYGFDADAAPVDDSPTVANPYALLKSPPIDGAYPEEVRDTVVNELPPEIDEIRVLRASAKKDTSDAGASASRPKFDPLASMAAQLPPTAPPARQPVSPPMPAVMIPALTPPGVRAPSLIGVGDAAPSSASHPFTANPSAPSQALVPSESPLPPGFVPSAKTASVDMERLFAPPPPNEQRTVTAQARKRRPSMLVMVIASAALGALAFAIVSSLLRYTSGPGAAANAAIKGGVQAGAAETAQGPFVAARHEFAAALPAANDDGSNSVDPASMELEPIPTTNVSSLPSARPRTKGGPVTVPLRARSNQR